MTAGIARQTTPMKGIPVAMLAAQTGTPNFDVSGGAIGAISVPAGFDGGLVWSWQGVYHDSAGLEVERPLTDTAGVAITSTVIIGTICEVPPFPLVMKVIRAKFSVTTNAQNLILFHKA